MALTRRFVRIGWEAFNRGDLDAAFMLYDPACESDWDPRFPTVGIESKIGDREERMRVQRRIWDDWGGLRFEPEELIGLGDQLVSVGRMSATGLRSGVPVDTDWAATLTIRGGRVIHERISMDRAEEIDALLGGA
jgi:ketosteroid isomerase-like protein